MQQPITVTRAIESLMRFLARDGDSPIVLGVKTLQQQIGAVATVPLTGFSLGFDWDAGSIFAHSAIPIQVAGEAFEAERAAAHEVSEKLGFIYLTLTGKSPDAEKLKNIRAILRRGKS